MENKIKLLFSLLFVSITFLAFSPKSDTTNIRGTFSGFSFIKNHANYETKFNLTYIVNPDRIDKEEYQRAMNEFRQKGFELGFSESYKEDDLEQLKISLGSNWNKVSATYQIDELRKKQYVIFIGANTETGDVTIVSRSSEE